MHWHFFCTALGVEVAGKAPAFQPAAEFGRTIAAEDEMVAKVMTKTGLLKAPAGKPAV